MLIFIAHVIRLNMQSEHIEELFLFLKELSGAIFEIMSIFILESKCEGFWLIYLININDNDPRIFEGNLMVLQVVCLSRYI